MTSTPAPPALTRTDRTPELATTPGSNAATRRWTAERVRLRLLGVVLLGGAVTLIRGWASGLGIWGDELYIAVNLRDRPLDGLGGRLDYDQVAPPGWLAVEKMIQLLFGMGERTLRVPAIVSVALILVLAGLGVLVRRGRVVWAAILAGVVLTSVGAAAVRGYPFGERVSLYLVAPLIITVVAAVDGGARAVRHALRSPAARPRVLAATALAAVGAMLVLVVAPAVPATAQQQADRRARDIGRAMLADVASLVQPGDVVLGYHFSTALLRLYGPEYGLPMVGRTVMLDNQTCDPSTVDKAVQGAKRVWYVRAVLFSGDPADYDQRVIAALATRGRVVAEFSYGTARAAVVDVTAGPDAHPPRPPYLADHACLNIWPVT